MNKTRAIQFVATILAVYGGGGAFMMEAGGEWPMLLFPLGVILVAVSGPLPRAVASAFTFSLSALCAMVAWRALGRGSPEWFMLRFELLSLFWLGMSGLVAAPLFERPQRAETPEPEAEAEPALEAELA
ncbi:MAG: hypothetical protein SF051_16035 [Elusimicrobiota bacterium]|nr:hypothetical protein [Elusimicrobiota bacterium]